MTTIFSSRPPMSHLSCFMLFCLSIGMVSEAFGQIPSVNESLFQSNKTTLLPNLQEKQQETFRVQGIDKDLSALIEFYRIQRNVKVLVQPEQLVIAQKYKIDVDPNLEFSSKALDELLLQLLRLNGQAMVPIAEKPGWLQIVDLAKVRPLAPILLKEGDEPLGPYATKVFRLKYLTNEQFRLRVEPFLSRLTATGRNNNSGSRRDESPVKGNIVYLDKWSTLLITDLVVNLKRTERLLLRLDVPPETSVFKQITINHQPVKRLAEQLRVLLSNSKRDSEQRSANSKEVVSQLAITEDQRGSRLLLRGTSAQVLEATSIIEQLDKVTDSTVPYTTRFISNRKFQEILQNRFGDAAESSLRMEPRSDGKTLVVSAPISLHQQIEDLRKSFDREIKTSKKSRRIQYYTIKNRPASEIVETIKGVGDSRQSNQTELGRGVSTRGIRKVPTDQFGGPGNFQLSPREREREAVLDRSLTQATQQLLNQTENSDQNNTDQESEYQSILQRAFVSVDAANNTIIVDADPEVQALYKDLIDQLDRKRPQVLVEVTVVSINQLEDTSLGIEVSLGDRTGTNRSFTFTQFGLSTAAADSGVLSLSPGVGFNGAILKPDVADVILRSLAQHERAKVVTAPRVLVRDNATGTLSSVAEVPFAGLNSGQNFASTTLQGFAEAGTTISVSPQISEANHLNLTFDILVNDFTGDAAENLPPPRQSNQITSEVAIPDGHTVIVGGLTRERFSKVQRGIPLLENIPVLRLLGGNLSNGESSDRLFVFIRPVILRDEQFKDLIQYTFPATKESGANDGFPESKPRFMYPKGR